MPKAIINWLYDEFFNQGNTAIADELISSRFTSPAGNGPEGFKAQVAALRKGFPDLHFTIHETVTEGTRVAVHWTWTAIHEDTFAGIAPTGRQISNQGIALYRVEDGKVVEAWSQMDRLGVLQQIGALPTVRPMERRS